jgi:hypothetical protein
MNTDVPGVVRCELTVGRATVGLAPAQIAKILQSLPC